MGDHVCSDPKTHEQVRRVYGVSNAQALAEEREARKQPSKEYRVLGENVLVRTLVQPEVSAGGIVMPATAVAEPTSRGEVVAVGPGDLSACRCGELRLKSTGVEVGDVVHLRRNAGIKLPSPEGEQLVVVGIREVVAVEGQQSEGRRGGEVQQVRGT